MAQTYPETYQSDHAATYWRQKMVSPYKWPDNNQVSLGHLDRELSSTSNLNTSTIRLKETLYLGQWHDVILGNRSELRIFFLLPSVKSGLITLKNTKIFSPFMFN